MNNTNKNHWLLAKSLLPNPDKLLPEQHEITLLASLIWWEARGEPMEGKIAVGLVVLNRVNDPRWINDLKGVILQPRQFSGFISEKNQYKILHPLEGDNETTWLDCVRAAIMAFGRNWPQRHDKMLTKLITENACFYKAVKCQSKYFKKLNFVCQIGKHEFYR